MSEQRTSSESRLKLKAEVEALAASDAPDEEVLEEVVRLVHDAHPLWDWSGIYLLVDGTLLVGPFAGSEEPPEHSRIEVGDGVCGTAVAEEKNQLVEDVRELDNYLACSLSPLRARGPHSRGGKDRRPVRHRQRRARGLHARE
ncbi:MAG: hypothetical protein K0S10_2274 [Rubrobacteraceae bacterium]|nr:hypothetical protein [Rubrobacteraceae bacterium]